MSGWVAGAVVVGSVIGAGVSYNAAEEAEDAQYAANQQARDDNRVARNQARDDFAPWRATGIRALNALERAQGLNRGRGGADPFAQYRSRSFLTDAQIKQIEAEQRPNQANPFAGRGGIFGAVGNALSQQPDPNWKPGAGNTEYQDYLKDPNAYRQLRTDVSSTPVGGSAGGEPDYGGFQESPAYQFNFDEGLRALRRSQGARGGTLGGGALREITRYGQGVAGNEFGNWFNRNLSLAGLGQTANTQGNVLNQNYVQNMSNAAINQGDARASSYVNIANGFNSMLGDAAYGYGRYANTGAASTPAAVGYTPSAAPSQFNFGTGDFTGSPLGSDQYGTTSSKRKRRNYLG